MGIFSDKCANPDCQGRVPKAAKYCRLCGSPAPDADTNCGRCGAVVATSSKFCWKCGANLADQRKTPLFDNRWVRGEDDFAIRVDECDIKGFLTKGLIVEHGTQAMVFQRGRFCGYVDPGSYDMNGFLKKVNNFNQATPTSVVLVDAGDVELHLEAIKLYSKEHLEVDATFKAVICLNDPEKMFTNAFKGRNQLSVDYLAGSLTDELRATLQTYVGSKSVQELYSNTEIRQEVERQMQLELEPILERIGLEMVQIRFVDFFCPAYDPIREQQSELYIDTRKAEVDIDRMKLAQRLRKEMTAEKMDKFKSEKDFEDFVRQQEHELGIKDMIRSDEMDKLKRQFAQHHDRDIVTYQIEIEGIKNDAAREEARKDLDAEIDTFLKKKDAKRKAEAEDFDEDMRQARAAVDLRQMTQQVELDRQEKEDELEAKKLQERSKASAQALLSILDGPAADRIMKLEELRAKEKLTPDQIVAMAAAANPQVAHVLAEKYKAEATINEERFKELQEFTVKQEAAARESADRLERVMNVALQQMGATATTRAQAPQTSQTVVTPGGGMGGAPVVITPKGPIGEKPCPKCKKLIPSDSRFCPNCREKL